MLTHKGTLFAGASVVVSGAGLALAAAPALLFGLLLAALLVAAYLHSGGLALVLQRSLSMDSLSERGSCAVRLRIHNRGRQRAFFELRDDLPGTVVLEKGVNYALLDLAPGEVVELRYTIRCPVKGRLKLGPVRLREGDVFGLTYEDREYDVASELRVYPAQEDLRSALAKSKFPRIISGDHQVGQPGAGSEFFALREYRTGDSIRDIDWKASARSKSLVVRQRERESYAVATVLVDARRVSTCGTVQDNPFLFSCRAAASLVSFLMDRRDRALIVLFGEGLAEIKPGPPDRVLPQFLDALMDAEGSGDRPIAEVVDQVLPGIKRKSPVFLVTSLYADDSIGRAVRTLRSLECRVVVVSPDVSRLLASRGTDEPAPEYRLLSLGRELALEELRGYGAHVVDWDPSEPLSASILKGVGR